MRNKNKIIYTLVALFVIVGLMIILEKNHVTNFISKKPISSPVISGPTKEQKKLEDAVNSESKKSSEQTPATIPEVPKTSNANIELSAKQEDSSSVTVFTKLYNISSGSCSLNISNLDKNVTQIASVFYQPEYASCAGFSVPISSLGVGNWNINLKVDTNGITSSKIITFEVK